MAKGDDALTRKRNKAARKKLRSKSGDSSSVSARIASIIAAKKRRMSGKRRQCQGMCFSLPTPDDPYNDRNGKKDTKVKPSKGSKREFPKEKSTSAPNGTLRDVGRENARSSKEGSGGTLPSGRLAKRSKTDPERTKEFGNAKDEKIAWVVSSAADSIARKDKEGSSFSSPYLLFLVPNQEKATQIRSMCKPLKALGVHTVSIHPGASLGHQIQGLKNCEPEFLVSTPERLLELVAMQAIDISGVSLLVVDGLESLSKGGYLDMTQSIRKSISSKLHTIVFSDSFSRAYVPVIQSLLGGPVRRLSLNTSVACQSACIIQSINFYTSLKEKLSKVIQALDRANGSPLCPQPLKMLFILGKECNVHELAAALKSKGHDIVAGALCGVPEIKNNSKVDGKLRYVVAKTHIEQISTIDIGIYESIFILSAFPPMDKYVEILTGMARHTVNGVLHSFISKEEASVAGSLVEILEQCGQDVPKTVRNLSLTQGTSHS
ncbi:pre-mRNA-processing ATP-dependent RNA helicase prp5 isoform X2 [Cucumis melo]|uniref:Pre-mRNA-processing ATP-dependent RNA helicase prp5 isoform X2 n=1 Tax=Cucumis melo TaxID=3656 RepID=A0ABM3KLX2_CUCME|nr:pre-mRNA-processing ATP-dependent RNA helicase prp5 isoform X2 [Cucumis melo]